MTITTEPSLVSIPLCDISDDGSENVRTEYDDAALTELAASIQGVGLINPLTVRMTEDEQFLVTAGHRRLRALRLLAKQGHITESTLITCVLDDNEPTRFLATMLVENLQRQDISIIDEARGYMRLSAEFGMGVKQIATTVGKKPAHVSERLALLTLPDDLQACIGTKVSVAVASDLTKIEDPKERASLAKQAVKGTLPTWKVTQRIAEQVREKQMAALTEAIERNMLTIVVRADVPNDYVEDGRFTAKTLKTYEAKRGDKLVVRSGFNGQEPEVIRYRKMTKAELAEQEARRTAVVEVAPNGVDDTPYREWEARYDAHEKLVEEFNEQCAAVLTTIIRNATGKTLAKWAVEQIVTQTMGTPIYTNYVNPDWICEQLSIDVVDDDATTTVRTFAQQSTENALRVHAFKLQPKHVPSLQAEYDRTLASAELADPGPFTEPEPWYDEDANAWRTDDPEAADDDPTSDDAEPAVEAEDAAA